MAILTYHDEEGNLCKDPWPPGDLREVESLYHDCGCQCASCAKEEAMNYIKPDDVVIFAERGVKVEVTGRELSWKAAADEVHRMVKLYLREHP